MGRGGAERQLSLLARALSARGLHIVVAVFYAGGALERELHEGGVEVLDLKKSGRWSNVAIIRTLMSFVRERRPRIFHSYMVTQNLMALTLRPWLARKGCAVVLGIRTALPNAWRYSKMVGLADFVQSVLLTRADLVISNSRAALLGLPGRASGKAVAIPNGVECERYAYEATKRRVTRNAWHLGADSVLIGVVGRLDPQKNHTLLIDAMKLAGDVLDQANLIFVGDDDLGYGNAVRSYAADAGMASRIVWVGAADDMSAVYSALDVLCLCSVTEGFPNVLAEAMCVGLPCVTTDVGDAADLVGDRGWVVPPGDARALADALIQSYHALPGWNREWPRARVVDQFSVDALADRSLRALAPFLGKATS